MAGGKVHEVEVVFSFAPYEAPSGWETPQACDRACLKGMLDNYLAALAARDPARLHFAHGLRYTENGIVAETRRRPVADRHRHRRLPHRCD